MKNKQWSSRNKVNIVKYTRAENTRSEHQEQNRIGETDKLTKSKGKTVLTAQGLIHKKKGGKETNTGSGKTQQDTWGCILQNKTGNI